jgi:DNA-binding NtrC family response regulator
MGVAECRASDMAGTAADLIVIVVNGHDERAACLLDELIRRPVDPPTLAVLPTDAQPPLFRLAGEAVDDLVFSPVRTVDLIHRVERALAEPRRELEASCERLLQQLGMTRLIGRAPVFLRAVERVPRFARADVPVLITGETGTGKELCARALHHLGQRRTFPFVTVDCGAVPEQLFENELFGHVRGAFTGADREHKGLVAMAEGGCLFLDEIDALSLASQAKLLRLLQEGTFRSLGSERSLNADVKVIGATNRDLDDCVRNKQFRSDLFFRLNVLRVHLPPLRERREDIEMLAQNFLAECRGSLESAPQGFSSAGLRLLRSHDWPGNIRELGNVVQRAAVACDGDRILPSHIDLQAPGPPPSLGQFRAARAAALAAFERRYVEELLRKHGGNVTHAAIEAQQDRRAFGRIIKKHQINREAL